MSDDAPRGNPGVDPDDLDISKSEYVRELGDDRYVVSPGRRQPQQPPAGDSSDGAEPEQESEDSGTAATTDAGADAPGDLDIASTAEAAREGLSPAEGPGAAGAEANSASATPSASSTPATGRTPPNEHAPSGDAPIDDAGDSTPASRSTAAGADDGLPDAPAGGDGLDDDDSAIASEQPASHARRGAPRGEAGASPSDLDAGAVGEWLAASLADTEFAYGFDATLSLDGRTARHRMASDDVGETFETLVTWFADAAGGDTDVEDALGILLAGMDTAPRLPPDAVRSALAGLGVSRGDSVADVLAAIEEAGGLRLE